MDADSPNLSDVTGRIAFLGAGVMGGAVLEALLGAGLPKDRAVATDPSEQARRRWSDQGVEATDDNVAAARGAAVVVLGVKPHLVPQVLDEVAEVLTPESVVVSLAAGVTLATLAEHAGADVPVVRVMPNTPAVVGEGMFVLTPGERCGPRQLELVQRLLAACGRTETVPEHLQAVATGLSGSGPAYVFYVADALVEGAVREGLPRALAAELAAQTLYGAAAMLRDGDVPAALLRERVTSPGGTTAAGLRALDAGAVRYHLGEAVAAATAKAVDLGG